MSLKNRIIFEASIVVIIVFAIAFFAINPVLYSVKSVVAEMNAQEAENKRTDQRIESVKEFRKFYQTENTNFSKLDMLFMDSQMPLDFIYFLEKTAKDCGMEIAFSPSSPAKMADDAWESVNFETTISGSFNGAASFIKKMESSPYLVGIQNLEMKSKKSELLLEENGERLISTVEAKMVMKVFSK